MRREPDGRRNDIVTRIRLNPAEVFEQGSGARGSQFAVQPSVIAEKRCQFSRSTGYGQVVGKSFKEIPIPRPGMPAFGALPRVGLKELLMQGRNGGDCGRNVVPRQIMQSEPSVRRQD